VPGWHKATKAARKNNNLVLIGVIQEQHAQRCQLFAQWKQFDWPILHDPLNVLELRVVPVPVAIDEHGIVRSTNLRMGDLQAFLDKKYEAPATPASEIETTRPVIADLAQEAAKSESADSLRQLGDALVLWENVRTISQAVSTYRKALVIDSDDSSLHFRLGVAYRMRHDSPQRQDQDFQYAVTKWGRALELDPNHYIYRRRIEQYGPRLIKPYAFYDWVKQARVEIRERGEIPVQLAVEPSGAEIAHPARRFDVNSDKPINPDPSGKIDRDKDSLVRSSVVVVPHSIRSGESTRVHLRFLPGGSAHWNNEVQPLRVWVDAPEGWRLEAANLTAPLPKAAESTEERTLEFEIQPVSQRGGKAIVRAYALYYVCEEEGGTCLYLRKDIEIPIQIRQARADD
jgi:tetratricopeptide (TPR) repeat protein